MRVAGVVALVQGLMGQPSRVVVEHAQLKGHHKQGTASISLSLSLSFHPHLTWLTTVMEHNEVFSSSFLRLLLVILGTHYCPKGNLRDAALPTPDTHTPKLVFPPSPGLWTESVLVPTRVWTHDVPELVRQQGGLHVRQRRVLQVVKVHGGLHGGRKRAGKSPPFIQPGLCCTHPDQYWRPLGYLPGISEVFRDKVATLVSFMSDSYLGILPHHGRKD